MRRTSLRRHSKSKRSRLIKECDALLFRYLKLKHGEKCQFCDRDKYIGPFHILPKSTAPRLRFSEENVILVCWPCHSLWHHDYFAAKEIDKKIMKLRGDNYEDELRYKNRIATPITAFELEKIKFGLMQCIAKHGR